MSINYYFNEIAVKHRIFEYSPSRENVVMHIFYRPGWFLAFTKTGPGVDFQKSPPKP